MRNTQAGRYELIASIISSKRALANLEAISPEDRDLFYDFQYEMLATAKEFDEKRFQRQLEVPDLDALSRERYRISKSEIATVPEKRELSHILLLCSDTCDEAQKRAELETIRSRVMEGENFSDMAIKVSEDPGSYQNGGRLSRPIAQYEENVDESFRAVAFALSEVGEVSEVVQSRFGFHIMRLEAIIPERQRTYEEVRESLMREVEKRYREDAYRTYLLTLGPSDQLSIDAEVVDRIMGPLPGTPEAEQTGEQ
jgi:parvulin-like peptidyl-prolyl isomerase